MRKVLSLSIVAGLFPIGIMATSSVDKSLSAAGVIDTASAITATAAVPTARKTNINKKVLGENAEPQKSEGDLVTADAKAASNEPTAAKASTPSGEKALSALAVKLNLKREGERLYAYMTVQQGAKDPGHIRVEWSPQSGCTPTHYDLAYQGKQFHTRAYRTVTRVNAKKESVTCTGTWQVKVVDANGAELATSSFNVTADTQPAQ
jgi:hypothetical protein